MVDPGRMRRLLDRLGDELAALRRLAERDPADLLADPDLLAGVKYRFIVVIEVCVDAGEHIIASEQLRAPESFADVFAVLAEAGWVPSEHVETLQGTTRFRNLLVHQYADVDDQQVIAILQSRLDDLAAVRQALAERIVHER